MGDPALWKRTLKQACLVTALILALGAVGQRAGPGIMRVLTRTPDPLSAVCEVLGVAPERASLVGWAEMDGPEPDEPADLRGLAGSALRVLAGDAAVATAAQTASSDENVAELTWSGGGQTFRARCRRIGEGGQAKLYLVCEADLDEPQVAGLQSLRKRLDAALHTLGRGSRRREPVFITVYGRLSEQLTASDVGACAKKVASRLYGTVVDVISGEDFFSALLHGTMLGPAISIGGKPVNMGLVFKPDPEAGCTRIIIGTPLYAGDY